YYMPHMLSVPHPTSRHDAPPISLLETFASQTALVLERALLAEEAQQAQLQVETERLRNALLSSVSHDLRTPLTAITGATSTLLADWRRTRLNSSHQIILYVVFYL